MKITDIECIHLRVPKMDEECAWGDDALLVKVHTDAGLIGIGETDTSPLVAKAVIDAPSSNLHSSGLKRLLIGENPLEIQRLWDKMYLGSNYFGRKGVAMHAISAIDIALWDIASQHYGVPLYTLLGGKYRDKIEVYGTFVTGDTPEKNNDIIAEYMADGFNCLKFGDGVYGNNPDLDVKIVESARLFAGDDLEIAIDVQCKWLTYGNAAQLYKRMEPYNLKWIEEPILDDDLPGYARLSDIGSTRTSGGERLAGRQEFTDFIKNSKVDIVQPDITRCGGISELKKINEVAETYGCKLLPHGYSTGILLAASIQFLAATKYGDFMEYSKCSSPLFTDLVTNLIPMKDGYVTVPDTIGLGIELNEDVIEKYKVKG